MDELIFIAVVGAGLWYWWDTQQSKELALAVCRQKCHNNALQLLDSTVTRRKSWLRRTESGGLQICRLYSFEYSVGSSGQHDERYGGRHPNQHPDQYGDRVEGYIVLLGKQVVETSLPHQQPYQVN